MPKLLARRRKIVQERFVRQLNPATGRLKMTKIQAASNVQPVLCSATSVLDDHRTSKTEKEKAQHSKSATGMFQLMELPATSNVQPVLCSATDVLDDHRTSKAEKEKDQYLKSREQRQTSWDKIHNQLLNVHTELYAPSSSLCKLCSVIQEVQPEALIRCLDCGSHTVFCAEHYVSHHQKYAPFHCADIWNGHCFVPYTPVMPALVREDHIEFNCHKRMRSLSVVGMQGRPQMFTFEFCACEGEPVTLLRHRLWAASPVTPTVAFTLDLMTWLRALVLECQVSVKGFVDALASKMGKIDCLNTSQVQSLYRSLIIDSFSMFMRHYYKISHLQHINKELDNGTACPACDSTQQILSFDANFGLKRKKSSGKSLGEPFHKGHFFIDQAEVDNFLATQRCYQKKGEGDCSNFRAGNNRRSKSNTEKMDETAVFGCACRHEYPRLFFSLKHGERLGYPVFLLNKLMEGNGQQLTIMYDIACVLEAHLKKNRNIDSARIQLALPIFHSYGHKMSCQMKYGPRKAKGIGLTDGETMERLWSYLRKFSTITKQMTAQRRVDLLTDALLHYASKLRKKLGKHIQHKMKKVKIAEEESKQQLEKLMPYLTEPIDLATIECWQSEERSACKVADEPMSAREKYVLSLYDLYSKQSAAAELSQQEENTNPELFRLSERVRRFQQGGHEAFASDSAEYKEALSSAVNSHRKTHINKLRAAAAERRSSLIQLHEARGQDVAKKISKTVAKLNKQMKVLITSYNSYSDVASNLPSTLSFADVSSEECQVFSALPDFPDIKRKMLHIKDMAARCTEETQLLNEEAATARQFYVEKIALCQQLIADQVTEANFDYSACSRYSIGRCALLHQQVFTYEQHLAELQFLSSSASIQLNATCPLMDEELMEISNLERDELVSRVEDGLDEDESEDEESEERG